ncbi:molybdopterin-dependent oxidoreductase [Nocardia goodfellowii]|uniref:DMSO/TMAO reductase YedYZ molybdopterin-dependent catalytic subunit n=1 Tax=Nocardia goodfellowii TaxID=882446 RepID=A0ABS4QE00_9NOCA|nr:molybdopterin-dependent oxidoreductase [Nocardia goodfellowii]MBP2189323.1 DMSO/TMAO reductase YedYZ molybdopterin-dependent catalytic subunit [Nocardia goodfellowii]
MAELRFRVVAGILAAGLALGVAELVAAFTGADSAPLVVLGSTVIDHTPDGLREWAIQTFGTNDKAVLYLCMGVVAAVFAGIAGAVERAKRAAGSLLLGLFGVLVAVIAVGRTGAPGALPTVLGVAAGIYALRVLTAMIDDAENAVVAARSEVGEPRAAESPISPAPSATIASGSLEHAINPTRSDVSDADSVENASEPTRSDASDTDSVKNAPTPTRSDASDINSVETATAPTRSEDHAAPVPVAPQIALPERRTLLRGILITGGLAVAAGVGGRLLGLQRADVSVERAAVRLPQPSGPPISLTPEADLQIPGLAPYLTPNSEFYRIDTALTVPQVSIEDWSLRIHGLVDREITLSWADLANRTAVERLITLACVSNPIGGDLIGNALWRGYRLDELLAEAGAHPDADMVLSTSKDGWTCGTPLSALTDGRDSLLAVGMNGEPLPVSHGYPARLVVPGLYGYVSATKWVTDLEITRFDRATAYWTRRGWSAQGPIKTASRIDTPRARARLSAGRVPIAGIAWAQHRGITAVEVQIDSGPWQPARLSADQSIDTWRQWVYDWDATPGPHTIRARATDATGQPQTAEFQDVIPDGATGYPSVNVQVS